MLQECPKPIIGTGGAELTLDVLYTGTTTNYTCEDDTYNDFILCASRISNSPSWTPTLTNATLVSVDNRKNYKSNYISRTHGAYHIQRVDAGPVTITIGSSEFSIIYGY